MRTSIRFVAPPLALLSILTVGAVTLMSNRAASVDARSAGTLMIKANDLAQLPTGTGPWAIVGCGITALNGWSLPPLVDAPATGPCDVGQDRIFTSYTTFEDAVSTRSVDAGDTIIFDPEAWFYTPRYEFDNQIKYLVLAGKLARSTDIQIIYTPPWTLRSRLNAEYRAIAPYASLIEIQSQYLQDEPATFRKEIVLDLAVIRAINPTVPVLAGFATDPGGRPAVVSRMIASYKGVSALVQGFQLNLARWRAPRGSGCALNGCVEIGTSFLRAVGAQ